MHKREKGKHRHSGGEAKMPIDDASQISMTKVATTPYVELTEVHLAEPLPNSAPGSTPPLLGFIFHAIRAQQWKVLNEQGNLYGQHTDESAAITEMNKRAVTFIKRGGSSPTGEPSGA
jgi:hypothetical protein